MKAVIFDMDGVIINSEPSNIKSVKLAFKKLGIKITKKEIELIIGRNPKDYKNYFSKKYEFNYSEFNQIRSKLYKKLVKSSKLFKNTFNLIKEIEKEKLKIALATSSKREETIVILKRAKLSKSFNTITTWENVKKRKPNPEVYLITAKKLKVNPKDCIVIEDSSVGVIAAKKAGMKCVALLHNYNKNQDLSKADLKIKITKKIKLKSLKEI